MSEQTPEQAFADFLGAQLDAKPNRFVIRDPNAPKPPEPETEPYSVAPGDPLYDRDQHIADLRRRYHLSTGDVEEWLAGQPDDKLERIAERLANEVLDPNRPRKPKPDPTRGHDIAEPPQSGAAAFTELLRDALSRQAQRLGDRW
jgi:hypothetical protein